MTREKVKIKVTYTPPTPTNAPTKYQHAQLDAMGENNTCAVG